MPDQTESKREAKRLMGIIEANARAALAKPESQREYFLATCRTNWKRYAAGLNKSKVEGDLFVAMVDRATRDFVTVLQGGHIPERPWAETRPDWPDTVEGAMDSVIVYEAAVEPVIPAPEPPREAATMAEIAPGLEPGLESGLDSGSIVVPEAAPEVAAVNAAPAEPAQDAPPATPVVLEEEEPVRYSKPVLAPAGAKPLGSANELAAKTEQAKPEFQDTPELIAIRDRTRKILGKKLLSSE